MGVELLSFKQTQTMGGRSMKALVKDKPEVGYKLQEMPVPEIGRDEVLFRVEKVAICGSDIALHLWNEVAKVIATVPFIPGHEATGVVVQKGEDVRGLEIGSRIAIENHFYCEDCYSCKRGRGDICASMSQYGHGKGTTQGGFSELSAVKAKYCYKLKTNISFLDAVLLEPMGVAYNGVNRINVKNEDVLILGAGAIGLLAASVSKALGARRVVCVDVNDERLSLAVKMGADVVVNSTKIKDLREELMRLTSGDGFSRLVEASGASVLVNQCFKFLQKGAELVLIGLHRKELKVDDYLNDIVFKSLTLHTVHGRRIFQTWEACEALVAEGKVKPSDIVSHQFNMSDFESAFDTLMSGKACKIVVDPKH